jgi:hypothetical protein
MNQALQCDNNNPIAGTQPKRFNTILNSHPGKQNRKEMTTRKKNRNATDDSAWLAIGKMRPDKSWSREKNPEAPSQN